jgi:hypothetical protein
MVAAGRASEARALTDAGIEAGTYLDQQGLDLAGGFARLQAGESDAAAASFDAALETVDATEARLDQAIVRLARARAWGALGRPDVAEAEADASAALATLGHTLSGWDRIFTLASGSP